MTAILAPPLVFSSFTPNGIPNAFGTLASYIAGTSTPLATYVDSTQTTPNTNPIVLNNLGQCALWLDPTKTYKFLTLDNGGNQIGFVDQVQGSLTATALNALFPSLLATFLTQSVLGAILYPQTAAELAAGVTPTNYGYAPGTDQRYGAVGNGVTNDYAALNASIAQFNNGGVLPKWRALTYAIGTALALQNNLILDLNRATIKPSGAADAFDVTDNAVGIKNGKIDLTNTTGKGIFSNVGGGLQQLLFKDLYVSAGAGTCLELVDCYSSTIENVRIVGGSGRAVYLRSSIVGTPVNGIYMNRMVVTNFTGNIDTITLEGCAGCTIFEGDFESNNNAGGPNVIHISPSTFAGCSGNTIESCYFEDGAAQTGNCILVGSGAGGINALMTSIITNYFATSKQPINIGQYVTTDSAPITGNTFINVGGTPTAGVLTPFANAPNCHSNGGSIQDIVHTFTPTLLFGGAAVGMTGTFTGEYRRIGNHISGDIRITLTALGSSTGGVSIGGLPVPSSANVLAGGISVQYFSGMVGLTAAPIFGRMSPSASAIGALSQATATATTDLTHTSFGNTSLLYVHFEYEA